LPEGIVESIFVAVDHVPEYVNALPSASSATQNELETQETALSPCVSTLSTLTGADQAPLPAGAFVGAPLFGVVRNDGNEIVGVEVEPHATASNPADAAAAMESRRRLTDANGTNDLRFSFIEASTAGAPNGA
jgi:hypothetical protein